MCVEPIEEECDLLSVESGEWRKLRLPPYVHHVGRKSVCVNGSIYWMFSGRRLQIGIGYKILALDLHKPEFHNVSVPSATWVTRSTEIVNLGERLAIAKSTILPEWTLEIWTMNANEEIWSKTFSINLGDLDSNLPSTRYGMDFTPVSVSKQEFHNVSVPSATWVTRSTEIVNLGERLAIAKSTILPEWTLEIWTMNANEEIWSKTFSINLGDLDSNLPSTRYGMDFTPVSVSKQGNVVFCNNFRNLFKYYSEAKEIHCLSLDTLVISPYIENLVPLWGHQEYQTRTCRCRLFSKEQEQCFKISKLLKR
ncbi:hypothetical protein DY000_02044788, partial [Brassica cretica]